MSRGSDAARSLRVGVVVLLSLLLFAAGIWTLGEQGRIWSPKVEYLVRFSYVQGLAEGSTVALAGYTIGTVDDISLPPDVTVGRVEVRFQVERRHAQYIRADTRARIKTIGLLGDKYIDLTPGSMQAPALTPGSEITAVQPPNLDSLMAAGESVADNLVVLTTSLRRIFEKIDRGEGLMGAVISDTPEGRKLGDDIKGGLANLRELTEKVNAGKGTLAMLLNDARPAADLRATVAALRRVTHEIESGQGLAARLLRDKGLADRISSDLGEASTNLRRLSERLSAGEGLLGRLTREDPEAERIFHDLGEASKALASITRTIAEGEGSLGKLVYDDTLYRGLNDILAGANKSWLTRYFIARSQKAGAGDRKKGEPKPAKARPARTPASSPR